jgi:hypothetical protein
MYYSNAAFPWLLISIEDVEKKCFWFYSAQVYAVVENRGTNSDHYMHTAFLI